MDGCFYVSNTYLHVKKFKLHERIYHEKKVILLPLSLNLPVPLLRDNNYYQFLEYQKGHFGSKKEIMLPIHSMKD